MLLLSILPGVILMFLSLLFVAAFVRQLLTDPNALLGLMLVGLVIGFAWYVWMQLPGFFRKFIHKTISKGGKHDKAKH